MQQSLVALLSRRKTLEDQIARLRDTVRDSNGESKAYAKYRSDALKALEDARKEQQELVLEQVGLLEMMQHGTNDESELDPSEKSVRVDTGGHVAESLDAADDVHDAELYVEETGREGAA